MNISVEGKVILVTGASRGIGRSMAYKLAQEGAKVIVNYHNSENDAQELLEEISKFNKSCIAVKADVSSMSEVHEMRNIVNRQYGYIDELINNAGICQDGYSSVMPLSDWQNVLNINLTGTFICSKCFSRDMIRENHGKIINIASLKGSIGSEGQANYSASKAGVIGFTKALAKELGQWNILVNAICPGFVRTDLNVGNEYKKEIAQKKSVLNKVDCLQDFLDFITYISSDQFSCISGQVFNLDSRIK